jgi:hypothetical protein
MSLTRPATLTALFTAVVLCSRMSSAEPDTTECQLSRGSLAYVGCSLARKLLPAASAARVTIVELKSDRELPAPDALRERVQSALQTALGPAGAGATGSKSRVELSIEKSGGVLRVTADVRRAIGLWQRVRHKRPGAEQHAFVEVPLDAELRALIPPPPLVVSETLKLKAPERGIVALACGPLASDGGQELALVSRSNIRVGRIAGRAFVERRRAAWSALSSVAPTPLREPIAVAEIAQGKLRVGLTDRRDGLVLSGELAVIERLEGLFPLPGEACLERNELGLLARQLPCSGAVAGARRPAPTLDALAGMPRSWLARDVAGGTLLAPAPGLVPSDSRVGAQLAMGDADSDGKPELAFSSDTLEPSKDRLTLVTLEGGKLRSRFEVSAPSISAIAICGREGAGMAPIVLASGDELWLLR